MPYADDLEIGIPLAPAPDITVDAGVAAQYQAIIGDPLALSLSTPLSRSVTGLERLVNPSLMLHIAIGQSTVATRRVIANLFYRNVVIAQQIGVGATLCSTVTPVARERTRREDRSKVLLDIRCTDEQGGDVVNFQRLALLPVRDPAAVPDVGEVGTAEADVSLSRFAAVTPSGWDLSAFPAFAMPSPGIVVRDPMPDSVTGALELVRLTQNGALAHRDAALGQHGRRLVYGGHVVGLAQAALVRTMPGVVTVLGWRSCNHLAPVFEDDVLRHEFLVHDALITDEANVVGIRCRSLVERDGAVVPVLDWEPVVLTAQSIVADGGPGPFLKSRPGEG